jgi:hypothetical protein
MTQEPSMEGISRTNRAVSRGAVFRAIGAVALLVLGIATVRGLEAAMHATFNKPPAPLRIPLRDFRQNLGTPVLYLADGADEIMEAGMVQTLGTDEYLVRRYREKPSRPGDPGARVKLNLNYYATGSSTPHVPEICWAANGLTESPNSRQVFDVPDVKHADGSVGPLRMRLITFLPPKSRPSKNAAGEDIYYNVAYVFQVNGEYVATPREVMSHFWSASNRFAYHCKIEVAPLHPDSGELLGSTQAEAREIVSRFIREALPAVEDCLPDPIILKQGLSAERGEGER